MNKTRKYSPAKLKALREACGLSVLDVVAATGLTRAHINAIERETYTGNMPVVVIDYLEDTYKKHVETVKNAYNAAQKHIAKTEQQIEGEGKEPLLDGIDISWRRVHNAQDKLLNSCNRDLMLLLALNGYNFDVFY